MEQKQQFVSLAVNGRYTVTELCEEFEVFGEVLAERFGKMEATVNNPVCPGTFIRVKDRSDSPWVDKKGCVCRVGFYSESDTLSVVWIVDQNGDYVETTDQVDLSDWFEILFDSQNKDYFANESRPLGKIPFRSLEKLYWS